MRILTIALLSAFLFVACGSDGGSEVTLSDADKQSVQQNSKGAVDAAADLGVLKTDGADESAFSTLGSLWGYANGLSGTKAAAQYGGGTSGYYLAPDYTTFIEALGCATESGNTYTYDCPQISGTVTIDGDSIAIDITMDAGGSSIAYQGNITITDTSIDGSISFQLETNQGLGGTMSIDSKITYSAVMLDTTGCPTGGSLKVKMDVDLSGIEGVPSEYAGAAGAAYPDVTIDFGPACGDVAMF